MPARFPHGRPICRSRAPVRDCVEKFDMNLSAVIEGTTPNEAQGRPRSSPHVAPLDRTARLGRAPWHRVTRGRKSFWGTNREACAVNLIWLWLRHGAVGTDRAGWCPRTGFWRNRATPRIKWSCDSEPCTVSRPTHGSGGPVTAARPSACPIGGTGSRCRLRPHQRPRFRGGGAVTPSVRSRARALLKYR